MAGLDDNMLNLIRCLAENRYDDAKKMAAVCCSCDETKKNKGKTAYYKKLLENGSETMVSLPAQVKGLMSMQDVSGFREERYFLSEERENLFREIEKNDEICTKMMELGIPYLNSTLIYGDPGTGKTEFARYTAYKLGLPYAYLNFSFLIDSYMGATSKNLQKVFEFCRGKRCVLMLDEIDCIGIKRGNDSGADGELGRTTIGLMQQLDSMSDGQIIIAATNREDRLDPALKRRFQRVIEFSMFDMDQNAEMIRKYLDDVGIGYEKQNILDYCRFYLKPQSEIIKDVNRGIAESFGTGRFFLKTSEFH